MYVYVCEYAFKLFKLLDTCSVCDAVTSFNVRCAACVFYHSEENGEMRKYKNWSNVESTTILCHLYTENQCKRRGNFFASENIASISIISSLLPVISCACRSYCCCCCCCVPFVFRLDLDACRI